MLHRVLLATALFGASTAHAFADVSTNPQRAPNGAYEQNPAHTVVTFCTAHMDVSTYCGRFNKTTARLRWNGAQPDHSTVSAIIDLASVDTTSDELDQKLRAELFKRGASATFTSTQVRIVGNNQGTITGDFAINGVRKPITLRVRFSGGRPFPFGDRYMIGFAAIGSFKRSDFGLTEMQGGQFAGDVVNLQIDIEFLQVK